MAVSIVELIAGINPDLYYGGDKKEFKKLISEKGIYSAIDYMKSKGKEIKPKSVRYHKEINGSIKISEEGNEATHTLVYESYSETLEPVYFFIIDLMTDRGLAPEKLIDNFSPTPGSPHFTETGMKMARMQEEATKIMGTINAVLRSVLNIIYDLKEFKIRLQAYDDLKSQKKEMSGAALQSLKQIWLDKVDVIKGQGSIHAMTSGNLQFTTLRDAFLVSKDEKDVEKLDLNERVKRILKPRIHEFNIWVRESEKELRKRYEIERNYLKSQVDSLKLYTRWVKPYLKTAQQLEAKENPRSPALAKAFNRIVLELTILGKTKINPKDLAISGDLPKDFEKLKTKRDYYSCILVDFVFRAIPQQGNFIGKSEVTFRAYALNEDELKKLDEELEKSDLGDALSLIEGATTDSLGQLQEEINLFLEEKDSKIEEKKMSKDASNPFLALIGRYDREDSKSEKKEEKKTIKITPDSWIEKEHLRNYAAGQAAEIAFWIFDIYKKVHGIPSYT